VNLKEYIESGVLESYALGQLGDNERRDVESRLISHPELRKELESIELALEGFISQEGKQPRPGLKETLLKSIDASSGRVIEIAPRVVIWKYATAASLVFAISASLLAYVFWTNWKQTENDLQERIALSQRMASDFNTVNERLNKIEKDMGVYDNPQFQKVVMKGTSHAPDAMASVYWNKTTKEVFVSIQNLQALSHAQQYQLWAIVDGKPIGMGVFDKSDGLIEMDLTSNASAFAVTIEPRGGKSSPTMEMMQVIGST
jgi:anti-sigma-K factor RskA